MQDAPFNYDEVPAYYIHCFADCPAANTCLHALAGGAANDDVVSCYVPDRIPRCGTECPHYQDSSPVAYGCGLMNFIDSIPHGKMRTIVAGLHRIFGTERQYYRARKGERLITPEQQEKINALASRNGFPTPVEYDSLVMKRRWEE